MPDAAPAGLPTTRLDWLAGVRVLLVGHYLPAPLAAFLLRGFGARVIKVEPPFGDLLRGLGPFYRDRDGRERVAEWKAVPAVGARAFAANPHCSTPAGTGLGPSCDMVASMLTPGPRGIWPSLWSRLPNDGKQAV